MIAPRIDATLLALDATSGQIEAACRSAVEFGCASVCVNPVWVPLVSKALSGSKVRTCSVAGFPLGASTTRQKLSEIEEAIKGGAQEIDLVMNLGWFKARELDRVRSELGAAAALVHEGVGLLKVIIETSVLQPNEIIQASKLVQEAGADFVKTSTGYGSRGASLEDIRLIRQTVGTETRIKASGGIRTREAAEGFLKAGADRLGISSFVQVIGEKG